MIWLRKKREKVAHLYDSEGAAVCDWYRSPPQTEQIATESGPRCKDCARMFGVSLSKKDMAATGHFGVKAKRKARKTKQTVNA
jgi:hypothetical protein